MKSTHTTKDSVPSGWWWVAFTFYFIYFCNFAIKQLAHTDTAFAVVPPRLMLFLPWECPPPHFLLQLPGPNSLGTSSLKCFQFYGWMWAFSLEPANLYTLPIFSVVLAVCNRSLMNPWGMNECVPSLTHSGWDTLCENYPLYFSGKTVNGNHRLTQEKLTCMLFG